jgi:hypothetical protein
MSKRAFPGDQNSDALLPAATVTTKRAKVCARVAAMIRTLNIDLWISRMHDMV